MLLLHSAVYSAFLLASVAVLEQCFYDGESSLFLVPSIISSLIAGILVFRNKQFPLYIPLILKLTLQLVAIFWLFVTCDYWLYEDLAGQVAEVPFLNLLVTFAVICLLISEPLTFFAPLLAFYSMIQAFYSVQKTRLNFQQEAILLIALLFFLFLLIIIKVSALKARTSWLDSWTANTFYLVISISLAASFGIARTGISAPTNALDKIGSNFITPLLVAEDPIFFKHHGVDFKRLRDATVEFIEEGKFRRGGSTITMQLAKVMYLSYDKKLSRKLLQIIIALLLELKYSKAEILSAYCEKVPFAPGVIGIEQASLKFFSKPPSQLTKSEALQLVLSIYNPLEYSPDVNSKSFSVKLRESTINARLPGFLKTLNLQINQNK